MAVDFDNAQQSCYIHVEGYLDNVRIHIEVVDQYRRGTCDASSTLFTSSTVTTSVSSSNTPPGGLLNSVFMTPVHFIFNARLYHDMQLVFLF